MMFSVKFFTIVSAVLAVAVNGSPAGLAEGGLEARSDTSGWVHYCLTEPGVCSPPSYVIDFGTCYNPGDFVTFSHESNMKCVGCPEGGCNCDYKHWVLLDNTEWPDLAWQGSVLKSFLCFYAS